MATNANLIETTTPSYEVIKWIGGGGFGQVFKVVRDGEVLACKQIQTPNPHFALNEHRNMALVKGGPYIATVHDDVEWNSRTKTLSFFMDYYKGKDLERLVHVMQASGGRFTETQLLDMACQITLALEHCHSHNILHQDMKPMNVLLRELWNPLTEQIVPELSVTDFGISSRVRTLGTRLTGQRGTPGYEAPEIRGKGHGAEFSQKSDIYALGCVLYRLCTLTEPDNAAGIQPTDISKEYSWDMLCLISSMLSLDRSDRPTVTQVKLRVLDLIKRYFDDNPHNCRKCNQLFATKEALQQHLRESGHLQRAETSSLRYTGHPLQEPEVAIKLEPTSELARAFHDNGLELVNPFQGPISGVFQVKQEGSASDEGPERTLCAACIKQFKSKKQLYRHLYCNHHCKSPKYIFRRFHELGIDCPRMKRKSSSLTNGSDNSLARRIRVV